MILAGRLKNWAYEQKHFLQWLVFLLVFASFGCSKSGRATLVDFLNGAEATSIVMIEQIDVIPERGLPSCEDLLYAKVLKRFQQQSEFNIFHKALVSAEKGRKLRHHPGQSGTVVLRVITTNGTWTIFCIVLSSDNTKTCIIKSGDKGETNMNRMEVYESCLLVEWIDEYLDVPH
jgi:hypothetical protein